MVVVIIALAAFAVFFGLTVSKSFEKSQSIIVETEKNK